MNTEVLELQGRVVGLDSHEDGVNYVLRVQADSGSLERVVISPGQLASLLEDNLQDASSEQRAELAELLSDIRSSAN